MSYVGYILYSMWWLLKEPFFFLWLQGNLFSYFSGPLRQASGPLGQALLLVRKTVEKQQLVVVHIEVEPGVFFLCLHC